MNDLDDKENQSPVRLGPMKSPSPAKASKKARSRSIGPGGLEELDAPKQQSPDRNRRKSAFVPAVKSILPSKEDEAKRREARRKSLANRRVSFAPEATLHTWDVIEYMRDATTSSASSEITRRASSAYSGPDSDPPSTPNDQQDEDSDLPGSPEDQRGAHQQKRRRSSAIPPMNFNSLDEDYSSSPVSGSSDAQASSDVEEDVDSEDDGESTAMSLDQGDDTMASQESGDSTGSSARLDAALRMAADQAGTRGIDFDEYGDMSMEMAGDEITNAFKPWSQGQHFPVQDQENVDPFSPAFSAHLGKQTNDDDDMSMDITRAVGGILPQRLPQHQTEDDGDMSMDMTRAVGAIWPSNPLQQQQQQQQENEDEDEQDDMTMDMTRPVGRILPPQHNQSPERTVSFGDETMDLTQAIGRIHQPNPTAQPPRSALKRRLSAIANDEGSPLAAIKFSAQEPQRRTVAQAREAKRRRSSGARVSLGDGTMDLTLAVGSIQHKQQSPLRNERRQSLRSRRSSGASSIVDEQTMEFTTAVGGIKQLPQPPSEPTIEEEKSDDNEDLSMELTSVLGRIQQQTGHEIERPATPRESLSPVRTEVPTTPKDQDRFKEAKDLSAKKLLTPLFENQASDSAVKDSAGSRRRSARKTPASRDLTKSPGFLSPAVLDSARKSPASVQKLISSAPRSPAPTQKSLPFAQKTPSAQASPAPIDQPGSTRKSPSVRKSPAIAVNVTPSFAKSRASRKSSKSPGSVRRSARKSIATVQPYEDEPLRPDPPASSELQDEARDRANDEGLSAPQITQETPTQSDETPVDQPVDEIRYPVLPATEPEPSPIPQPSPAPSVRSTQQHGPAVTMEGSPVRSPATPKQIVFEDLNALSPSLEKQLRSSPLKLAETPEQLTSEEPSRNFADSIKLLSTPRKDTGTSPLKRLRTLTPKKSPAKRSMTPKKTATPKLYMPASAKNQSQAALTGFQLASDIFAVPKTESQPKKVHLNEFLDLAGIKFMDLTATKRRHTTAPTPGESDLVEGDDKTIDLEGAVVAGACTIPMVELFQHACRELKRYISEGKSFLKTLEAEVYEEPPPFFLAYVDASPEQKARLDSHMRDIKTNARLRSKEIWYDWRSKLLDGLEDGLNRIKEGLEQDSEVLGEKERALQSILPELLQHFDSLQKEAEQLEESAAATSEEEKEELRTSRDRLVEVDGEIEERKLALASLEQDVSEQDNLVEAYNEGKVECLAAIQEAERVKESCRGWSIDEVQALKASVSQLEKQTGWSITSASGSCLTMTYRNTLQLFFNTLSFRLPSSPSSIKKENSPISLTYIGGSADRPQPEALTTEKRFFLQLMRAQLQCLDQQATGVKSLLDFVSNGWDTATRVAEQTRRLNLENVVSVSIQSDESLVIDTDVLLPKVETKVRVGLQLNVNTSGPLEEGGLDIKTCMDVAVQVVYGESYNEKNMAEFINKRVRATAFEGWDDAIRELRARLVATGRKGR